MASRAVLIKDASPNTIDKSKRLKSSRVSRMQGLDSFLLDNQEEEKKDVEMQDENHDTLLGHMKNADKALSVNNVQEALRYFLGATVSQFCLTRPMPHFVHSSILGVGPRQRVWAAHRALLRHR